MKPTSRGLLLVLAAGLLAQALLFAVPHQVTPLAGDQAQYDTQARLLAAGEALHPNFLWPPLYGRWLSGFYRLFGPWLLPVKLVQVGLLLWAGVLFFRLLEEAGIGRRAALLASGLLLCDPQVAAFAHYLWPEVLHLFLSLLGVYLIVVPGPRSSLRSLVAGLCFGLALLAKSLLGPFLPVLAVAAFVTREKPGGGGLLRPAALALGVTLVVAPVAVHNRSAYGTYRISSSALLNLWVGINDPQDRHDYDSVSKQQVAEYLLSSPLPARRDRIVRWRILHKVSEEGLGSVLERQFRKQYRRLLDKDSFFTDQLPGGRWGPPPSHPLRTALLRVWAYGAYALLLGLAAVGLAQIRGRPGWRAAALPLAFLLFNLAAFLLLHVKTRYRVAFLPCVAFFAALALDRSLAFWRRAPWREAGGLRLLAGALVTGLTWWLAFGG
ncbi:MAG TPA: glycosyltransferase family 39 protein [Vicinamibacteria bacterium]|nr:glycosyltransferase family 39 protein [Vicinamibacteria bacterium]